MSLALRAQWNATLASVPQFQTSIDQSAHRIAVLRGVAPSMLRGTACAVPR